MSNLIKPIEYVSLDAKTIHPLLELAKKRPPSPDTLIRDEENEQVASAKQMRSQILQEAEQLAEEQMKLAREQAEQLREQARQDIEQWWAEQRAMDAETSETARQAGFESGYQDGFQQAEQSVMQQYSETISTVRGLLEGAFEKKRMIIEEAEPFLLDVSTAIAGKIVRRQLELNPEWIIGMTKDMLSRKKAKGQLTLCVSPAQFHFLYEAREELMLAVDSQAELLIVPDMSVQDEGCVIRSDYGSMDARIDTQLQEIKQALLQVAANTREAEDDE